MLDFELSDSYHQFFKKTLAKHYLYGVSWSGHSQIPAAVQHKCLHYVAIIENDVPFDTVRCEVVDYHKTRANTNGTKLYCIHQHDFEIFLALNRTFAGRLKRFGWCSSETLLNNKGDFSEAETDESGWVAWQAMQATADLYANQSNNLRLSSLLPLPSDGAEKNKLIGNQGQLKQLIQENILQQIDLDQSEGDGPPFDFPEPVAIYLKLDQLILVSKNPAEVLPTSRHETITKWMDQHAATAVQVCTAAQLLKAIESEDLVAARLMSYQHIWGASVLKSLRYDPTKILTGAANVAAYWQFYGISHLLFNETVSDETDRKTIHDLQNRLLNIRLQNELFSRFGYSDKGYPDIDIPDRSAAIALRLQAIQDLFAWWTNFYLDQINHE